MKTEKIYICDDCNFNSKDKTKSNRHGIIYQHDIRIIKVNKR